MPWSFRRSKACLLVHITTDHQDLVVGHWPLSTHLIDHNSVLMAPGSMSHSSKGSDNLTIFLANVRGFQTNIGDLTHSHVIPQNPDIATVETFLIPTVPENFGKSLGFRNGTERTEVVVLLVVLQSVSVRHFPFSSWKSTCQITLS